MKRFLSIILTLMLVFTVSASIVLADEVVTETTETTEATETAGESTAMPEDFDETSLLQYIVYNVSDMENITVDAYITGTDGTLDYYSQLYAAYGQPMEETEYDGKRALSMGQSAVTKEDLADTGVAYIVEEGFFADKELFVYTCGTMLSSGYEEGTKIACVVFDFGDNVESREIIAGEQNSFMATRTQVNWINVLIVAMIVVVLILVAVTLVLVLKKKKKINAAQENSNYVSEDEVFEALVEEAADEVEVYEEAEPTVMLYTEDTEVEETEVTEEDK